MTPPEKLHAAVVHCVEVTGRPVVVHFPPQRPWPWWRKILGFLWLMVDSLKRTKYTYNGHGDVWHYRVLVPTTDKHGVPGPSRYEWRNLTTPELLAREGDAIAPAIADAVVHSFQTSSTVADAAQRIQSHVELEEAMREARAEVDHVGRLTGQVSG